MDETVRAIKEANRQAAIDKGNLLKQARLEEIAMQQQIVKNALTLGEFIASQLPAKIAELKQNNLAEAKILRVCSVIPVPRENHTKYTYWDQSYYKELSRYCPVGEYREVAGWWLHSIVKKVYVPAYYDILPRHVTVIVWSVCLDTDYRVRFVAVDDHSYRRIGYPPTPIKRGKFGAKPIPIRMPGNETLESMPGYQSGQAYDFSADIRQLDLESLIKVAKALNIEIPPHLNFDAKTGA